MMPGQPMPGRMMPTVAASIHPPGSGPTPPGMPPIPGNILGPRVPLTAPNGMCKYPVGGGITLGTSGESCTQGRQAPFVPSGV